MIRGSDDEFGDLDEPAFPTLQERRESASYHPRPFSAWPSRQEEEKRSIWGKARSRIARMFGRNGANGTNGSSAADHEASGHSPDTPLLEPFQSVDEALPTAFSEVSPLASDSGLSTRGPFESIVEADTDPVPEAVITQEVPQPGFFARLFGTGRESASEAQDASQTSDESNPGYFVAKFRAFYNEILHHKHQGSDITAGFATAILSQNEGSVESADDAARQLSARLQQMLELQQAEATWKGGETAARYPDAQYAMAVMADETLASADWKGKSAWANHALEQKFYKSHAADLEFFKRVDRLFKDGPSTPVSRDLARVYLLTLAAGFRGKYGTFGLTRALHEYRQRLYEYIHGGDALLLYDDERRIVPQAAAHTIPGEATARFSGAQRWIAIAILAVAAYTAIAHIAWSQVSAELRDVTARLDAANTPTLR